METIQYFFDMFLVELFKDDSARFDTLDTSVDLPILIIASYIEPKN